MSDVDLRVRGVICGVEPRFYRRSDPTRGRCEQDVIRTYGPAGSLWCPVHGHVLDVTPQPPLTGVAILCFGDGHSETVDLSTFDPPAAQPRQDRR